MNVLSPSSPADSSGGVRPPLDAPSSLGEDDFRSRLRRYRLALALLIAAVVMLFIGLSSAYVVRRAIPTYDAATGAYSTSWEPLRLPLAILSLNSCLLVAASLAIEVARRKLRGFTYGNARTKRGGSRLWLRVSLMLGIGFLLGQGIAWHWMAASGQLLSTGARSAFFYVLTGTHALHALVGVLAVLVIAVFRAPAPAERLAVDLAAWYLHSMALLWIYLICFLLFA
jgi:cytochrome c oxidase subunit 3